jgi:hypothetical protein
MPTGNAVDYNWYRYTSNDGRFFSVKADKDWGSDVLSGLAAFNTADPVIHVSGKRTRPRFVTFVDLLTGRTIRRVYGTVAAFEAVVAATTIDEVVPGLAGTVEYVFKSKSDERMARPGNIASKDEPSNV